MTDRWQSPCGRMELRLGDYREALVDVQADHCITDPPYSARTHVGHDSALTVSGDPFVRSTHGANRATVGRAGFETNGQGAPCRVYERRPLGYDGLTDDQARALAASMARAVAGWVVLISDHVQARPYASALAESERYVFAPLPWLSPGSRVRLSGDGPSSWTCWITVARPRSGSHRDGTPWSKWGTLPGGYVVTSDRYSFIVGAKPLDLMRAIVRDYSRPGDLIVDPCAGGGTTLLAAAIEGRRAIGAELDPDTYAKAVERLSRGYTPAMLAAEPVTGEQGGLEL